MTTQPQDDNDQEQGTTGAVSVQTPTLPAVSADVRSDIIPARILNEGNLRELPVFPLQKRRSKKFQTKDGLLIHVERPMRRDGTPSMTLWEVRGPLQPSDKAIFMAVESYISDEFLSRGREVPEWIRIPSYRTLLRHKGSTTPGEWDIHDAKDSLERIKQATLKSKGAWRAKRVDENGQTTEEWIEGSFNLYSQVWFRGQTRADGKQVIRGAIVVLDPIYRGSLNANHVIPLDYELWLTLKNPVARRLLEILTGKFYGMTRNQGRVLTLDYQRLCDDLPLEQRQYLSYAKRGLHRAHTELLKLEFLAADPVWEWTPRARRVQYTPGPRFHAFQTKKIAPKQAVVAAIEPAPAPSPEAGEQPQSLETELTARGISAQTAAALVQRHPLAHLENHLDIHDQELERSVPMTSPAGKLVYRIENDLPAPDWYKTPAEREAKNQRHLEAARKRAEDEAAEQRRRQWWLDETPQQHTDAYLNNIWVHSFQFQNGRAPTPEERQLRHDHELEQFRTQAQRGQEKGSRGEATAAPTA